MLPGLTKDERRALRIKECKLYFHELPRWQQLVVAAAGCTSNWHKSACLFRVLRIIELEMNDSPVKTYGVHLYGHEGGVASRECFDVIAVEDHGFYWRVRQSGRYARWETVRKQ